MKKIFVYILTAAALSFVSCDKIFDSLEGDLTKMDAETLAGSTAGLDRLMSTLYQSIPMGAFSEGEKSTPNANETSGGSGYSGGVNFMIQCSKPAGRLSCPDKKMSCFLFQATTAFA